jgi:hypothetical protein
MARARHYDLGQMDDRTTATRRWDAVDLLLYLVGAAGLAFALTGVWLGMRSVMDIGGACASGGPYEIATPCPGGVEVLLVLGFPIGVVSAGLMVWKGARLGDSYVGLVALAWPALFLSLGWNFLEYGVRNPFGDGVELGWFIPGVIFVIMGAVPLVGWFAARGHGQVVPGVRGTTTPIELNQLAAAMRQVSVRASRQGTPSMTIAQSVSAHDQGVVRSRDGAVGQTGMVDQLERLAVLRDSGALTNQQYEDAKMAVIAAAARGEDA